MRFAALLMILAGMAAGLMIADTRSFSRAYAAEECIGENCPPPDGQGSGGHECESKKKEQTVS